LSAVRIIVTKVASDVLESDESESASSRPLALLQICGRKTKHARECLFCPWVMTGTMFVEVSLHHKLLHHLVGVYLLAVACGMLHACVMLPARWFTVLSGSDPDCFGLGCETDAMRLSAAGITFMNRELDKAILHWSDRTGRLSCKVLAGMYTRSVCQVSTFWLFSCNLCLRSIDSQLKRNPTTLQLSTPPREVCSGWDDALHLWNSCDPNIRGYFLRAKLNKF
jgi:hypothetical protein